MSDLKQRGFSLVELMVAILLSIILLGGVLSIFFSSKVTYMTNEKTARVQENGRVALDMIVHDVRSAGYSGCAKAVTVNSTLNSSTSVLWNYAQPVQGYESDGAGGFAPTLGLTLDPAPVADSDVIVTRTLLRDGRALRVQANLGSETGNPAVTNAVPAPVDAGTIMMITNCTAASVFQATGWTAGSPNGEILHAVGGTNPGNATDNLGWTYAAGSRVAPLQTAIYYVANDPVSGEPGLFRQIGDVQPAEMLIEGVQALQIAYGEDTNADRIADGYVAANAVANWNNIISVSVAMLIRSDESGTNVDASTYPLLASAVGGKTLGPYDDRRQRMVFTTTIALRNRSW